MPLNVTRTTARALTGYMALGLAILLCDRLTKLYALAHYQDPVPITPFLRFDLLLNRGISWGLFHSDAASTFTMVNCGIIGIMALLLLYTYRRVGQGTLVIGEIMVLAGGISNIIDRYLYQGVIDFIALHYAGYTFPVFNVADMAIVLGVGIIMVTGLCEKP